MRWLAAIALALVFPGCSGRDELARDAAVDTAIDAADPCQACGASQLCVARYDGTCRLQVTCATRTVDCPSNACSSACEAAYCAAPYQCQNRAPCGGEPAAAFTCYGP